MMEEEQETTVDLLQLARSRAVQYPLLGVNITRIGATLVIVLGPATTFTQGIDTAAMDDICRRWLNRMEEE